MAVKIGIDLGTSNTVLGVVGKGIILTEPTVVASLAFGQETPTDVDSCLAANLVANSARGVTPQLQALLAATLINFVAFRPRPAQTRGVETAQLIGTIQQRRRASVTISEGLQIPRERALTASLFSPSGAYLSWLAMDSEDGCD